MKLVLLFCMFACFPLAISAEKKENEAAKVQVTKLEKRQVYGTLIYGARLEPAALLSVYAPGNGIISRLPAKEGMSVSEGTLLAEVRRKNVSSDFLPWQIKSPIRGIVAHVDTVLNSEVFEKETLLTIGDISSYKVNLLLSDKDIQQIQLNGLVYVKNSEISGRIDAIGLVPEGNSGLFKVSVKYIARSNFFIGKFLELEIRILPFDGVVVPMEWIVGKYGKSFLYIYCDGKVDMREIQLGERYGKEYAVLSGVSVDELVITGYDRLLYSGIPAEVVSK